MNENLDEIITGCLLGDGCISKYINNRNSNFRYLSSQKDHVVYIYKSIEFLFKLESNIKHRTYYDNRTNKTYNSYYFTTPVSEYFRNLRDIWYPYGDKIIPLDLMVTPTVLKYWYIGDGHLRNDGRIYLCTNGFSVSDVDAVVPKLKKYNAKRYLNNIKQPVIIIPRSKSKLFFDDIGECPIPSYSHKWKRVPYLIKGREFELKKATEEEKKIMVEMYKNGKTYYAIAKEMGFSVSLVGHMLKRAGIYKSKLL